MTSILSPIVSAFGGEGAEYKPGYVEPSGAKAKANGPKTTVLDRSDPAAVKRAQAREAAMMGAISAQGIRIVDE